MADDPQNGSPKSDPVDANKEDADTAAARKELKQTAISEEQKAATAATDAPITSDEAARKTPEGDELIEQISSPKKKRARDVDDEGDEGDNADQPDAQSVASSDSAKDRASRLGPEKKRHRDDGAADNNKTENDKAEIPDAVDKTSGPSTTEEPTTKPIADTKDDTASADKDKKQGATSASAFASSGFATLSSAASPFGALGGSGAKTSVFGSGSGSGPGSTTSVFASSATSPNKPAAPAALPTLKFGNQMEASPFTSAAGKPGANGFGSAFGSGGGGGGGSSVFGSALSSKPLSSFGNPGGSLTSGKPVKPFGAPESDAEEGEDSDGEDASGSDGENNDNPKDESDKEDTKSAAEDKKKGKLQRVTLDDGETGETTILAVRSKLYFLEKEYGWRERGSGMLKINVPESCVTLEEGVPVPGSFDASVMEEEDGNDEEAGGEDGAQRPKMVRLLMRQDSTHRMLLNTVVLPALEFQEKTTLKSVSVLFTAFEGDGQPVSVQAKMSTQSAKSFMNEIGLVQRELSGN